MRPSVESEILCNTEARYKTDEERSCVLPGCLLRFYNLYHQIHTVQVSLTEVSVATNEHSPQRLEY